MKIAGSTILITGASQGIGQHLAKHFAGRGARVVIAARNEANLTETAEAVRASGGLCLAHTLDLSREESIAGFAAWLDAQDVAVDILVNNAADVTSKPLLETSPEEIAHILKVNVAGPLQLTKCIVPRMIERGRGMIVNISSLAGYKANAAQTVYSISKAAVNSMSLALHEELAGKGIHILNVPLPPVGTGPGRTPYEGFASMLEQAIVREHEELFLHLRSRLLMRLYGLAPCLARRRRSRRHLDAPPPSS